MKELIETWQARDGTELFTRRWLPDTEAKAGIALVHGLGEHSGRYQHVAAHFTRAGYMVQSMDLRGHGKTPGPRGHADSMDLILQDIDLLLEKLAKVNPGRPRFLYGHSLGGLLVLYYALRYKTALCGVISSAPGLTTVLHKQIAKVNLVRILGSLTPRLTIPTGLNVNDISRDRQVVDAYLADPLVHNRSSLGFGKGMLDMVNWVQAHPQQFRLPLLVIHGSADQLGYPRGSQEFARLVPGNVTYKLWEGLYHELHNEPEKEQVLQYLLGWMDQQLILQAENE